MVHKLTIALLLLLLALLAACNSKRTTPKPRGYYRIALPFERSYAPAPLGESCPYTFEVSSLATVAPATDEHSEPFWVNVSYPAYNAKIHISYKPLRGNLDRYIEDTHYLVYRHTVKADAIVQQRFAGEHGRSFGYLYEIGGNAASNVQFYLTDSARHFLRGSLYFNTHPNRDSLQPVIDYLTEDIMHLMETVRWK